MSDYDAAFAAAVGGPVQKSADPYDAIMQSIQPKAEASAMAPGRAEVKGTGSDVLDTGNAVGTGFFRGLTRLAGLPVDTVANVIDLGKAGIGSAYTAFTGKAPPKALELTDRADVIGSGDNLIRALGKTAPGSLMVNPVNPEYEGGYAQAAGGGLTAVMNPQSGAQAVNQAVLGVLGAGGAKAAMDATGSPALAVTASLLPGGVQHYGTAATKFVVRGGEAGRRAMEQRIQDLKNAGIDEPTLGLASGNKVIGGVENLLQSTPGAVGVLSRARDKAIAGLQAKADEAAALASSNRGTAEAGMAIQGGIRQFKDAYKNRQGALYGRLDREIEPQTPTGILNTRTTLANLNADIPGAPAMSAFFKNGKIQALEDALRSDTAGAPASVQVFPQPPRAGGGIMNAPVPQEPIQVVIPAGPQRDTLPWQAVKQTRTMVGNELADSSLLSEVSANKWRPLYGALSEDMGAAARAAGPAAERAFSRATDYTRAGAARLERVAPFANATAPEQAFSAMERAARENVSTLQAVKKTLPQDARGAVAGTIIERLGTATPGQQNGAGTAWSPETFLTNWNRMTPKARQELFSGFGSAPEVKANVEAVANAASMMRDSSKMWANPSGSGANMFARGMLGAVGLGGGASVAGLVNPLIPLGVGGSMLAANLMGRSLTSPTVVNAMARQTYVSPGLLNAQVNSLLAPGLLSQEPQ